MLKDVLAPKRLKRPELDLKEPSKTFQAPGIRSQIGRSVKRVIIIRQIHLLEPTETYLQKEEQKSKLYLLISTIRKQIKIIIKKNWKCLFCLLIQRALNNRRILCVSS